MTTYDLTLYFLTAILLGCICWQTLPMINLASYIVTSQRWSLDLAEAIHKLSVTLFVALIAIMELLSAIFILFATFGKPFKALLGTIWHIWEQIAWMFWDTFEFIWHEITYRPSQIEGF